MNNHNEAYDGANVGQQIGENYGETTFHNETIYHINQGDPPERRHEVALNFLAGGAPREAERLFGELLWQGHFTTERAYYYVLSAISGRSCNDVQGELLTSIVNARKMSASLPHDPWQEAFDAVWRLMRLVRGEGEAEGPKEDLEDVLRAFSRLPAERQDEIALHTNMILNGVTQARLESVYAHRVVTERMSNGRAQRAWKFFEPTPTRPRTYAPGQVKAEQSAWVGAVGGGAAVVLGVLFGLGAASIVGVLFALPLVAVGGYLLLKHGAERAASLLWLDIKRREVAPPAHPVEARSPGHWVSTSFVQEIHRIVDSRFTEARPHVAGDWPGYTAGIRAYLKQRLVDLYGNAQVEPGAVSWLVRWHARRVAAGWQSQALFTPPVTSTTRDTNLFRAGVAVAAAGVFLLLTAGAFGAALFIGAGGFYASRGIVRIRGLQRMIEMVHTDNERLYQEEMRGYEEWVRVLADRPSDGEMARWLAMDKIYLKNDVVKRANLTTHDLVTHVVMIEGANGAMRARVLHGPPRYSKYVVQIFLLTRSGVREARMELDFLTGVAKNERRNLFRYDALASASVAETGMRATRGAGAETREVERLRRRTFCLTLVNGQDITVVAETFGQDGDSVLEDESELFLVALQTSGIDAALPILEAVAAEGVDWIVREHERREQWARDWYE